MTYESELNQANKWNKQQKEIDRLLAVNKELLEALQRIDAGTIPAINGGTLYTDCQAFARSVLAKAT